MKFGLVPSWAGKPSGTVIMENDLVPPWASKPSGTVIMENGLIPPWDSKPSGTVIMENGLVPPCFILLHLITQLTETDNYRMSQLISLTSVIA